MLFGAFDVVIRRPRCPSDHIDHIISHCPPIHGTWHIPSAASSGTAAAIAPAAASFSFALSSMTTKTIRLNHCCACGGVFVVLFVVNEKTIRIHSFCACGGVFVVRSVVDENERYGFIHFGACGFFFAVSSVVVDNKQYDSIMLATNMVLLS